MSILDNELIRKYFGCPCRQPGAQLGHSGPCNEFDMPMRVLQAMGEPIKKNELYLSWSEEKLTGPHVSISDMPTALRIGMVFRLPDRFQKKKEHEHEFVCTCGAFKWHSVTQPAPAETEKCCPRAALGNGHSDGCHVHKPSPATSAAGQQIPCKEPMNHSKGCSCKLKPSAEEKCTCAGNPCEDSECCTHEYGCNHFKSLDDADKAVEDKIQKIVLAFGKSNADEVFLASTLRELVELVRNEAKNIDE